MPTKSQASRLSGILIATMLLVGCLAPKGAYADTQGGEFDITGAQTIYLNATSVTVPVMATICAGPQSPGQVAVEGCGGGLCFAVTTVAPGQCFTFGSQAGASSFIQVHPTGASSARGRYQISLPL